MTHRERTMALINAHFGMVEKAHRGEALVDAIAAVLEDVERETWREAAKLVRTRACQIASVHAIAALRRLADGFDRAIAAIAGPQAQPALPRGEAPEGVPCAHPADTMCSRCMRSDFSLIRDPDAKTHPGYAAFVAEMEGRAYGSEALNDAWAWFKDGWDGRAAAPPSERPPAARVGYAVPGAVGVAQITCTSSASAASETPLGKCRKFPGLNCGEKECRFGCNWGGSPAPTGKP